MKRLWYWFAIFCLSGLGLAAQAQTGAADAQVDRVRLEQRFESPAEEYGFELDRNRSYSELIPIALAEFKPGSEAIRQVNYFAETNRQMREQAQQLAAKKNYKEALVAIRGGTGYLQSALGAAGLQVPQETKIETAGRP